MNFDFNIFAGQPTLPTIWFVVVGVFWIGYLILDSFDLGVGMLMSRFFAKSEQERRLLLNTIGPVWDGNEVWVVTGGAATFAAFSLWYASLFWNYTCAHPLDANCIAGELILFSGY